MEKIVGNASDLRGLFPRKISDDKRQRLSLWDSPEALALHVSTLKASDAWRNSIHWKVEDRPDSFTQARSMEHAIEICRMGWPEGAQRAAALRDKINAAHPTGLRLSRWDVAGAYPSIPRALSGNPMAMRRIDSARLRRRPILTLMSDYGANGGVSAKAITNRAAVVAAIVDSIEAAGFSCHVIGYECSHTNNCLQLCATTVKDASQVADIGRMAFALGHAAMFRRLSWATITEDTWIDGLGTRLGYANHLDFSNVPDTYHLPSAAEHESAFDTEAKAATQGLQWLIENLQRQGCPAFPESLAA